MPATGEPGRDATAWTPSPRIAVEEVVPIARFDVPLPVPAPIAVRAAAASAAFRTLRPTVGAAVMSAEEPRRPSQVPHKDHARQQRLLQQRRVSP